MTIEPIFIVLFSLEYLVYHLFCKFSRRDAGLAEDAKSDAWFGNLHVLCAFALLREVFFRVVPYRLRLRERRKSLRKFIIAVKAEAT
jgi:hypothetical protein